jgi:hypothetical protein
MDATGKIAHALRLAEQRMDLLNPNIVRISSLVVAIS